MSYRLRGGGKSVHTPSYTSAAMPIDSPSVGCGWIVLPISTPSAPISIAKMNPSDEHMEAVLAEMRAYAEAARNGKAEYIPSSSRTRGPRLHNKRINF